MNMHISGGTGGERFPTHDPDEIRLVECALCFPPTLDRGHHELRMFSPSTDYVVGYCVCGHQFAGDGIDEASNILKHYQEHLT